MKKLSLVLAISVGAALAACGGEDTTPVKAPRSPLKTALDPDAGGTATTAPASTKRLAIDIDPVEIALASDDGATRLCDESLNEAVALLDEIKSLDGKADAELSWANTLAKLDRVRAAMKNGGDLTALLAVSHPDEKYRERAKACEPKVDKLETSLWLDAKLARVIKQYANKKDKETLTGPRQRLLDHTLRDFRRNGLDLDEKGQTKLRAMNEEITKLGQDFDTNIAESHLEIAVTPKELDGLPAEWMTAHPPGADGKVHVTTDYPDFYPVMQYAKDRHLALLLFKQFDNRAAEKNVTLLERLLVVRNEKAHLLGYKTWADFVIEPRMAKTSKTVADFLDGVRKTVAKKGDAELAEFKAMHVKLGGAANDPLPPSDRYYLEDQVRKAKYGLDSKEVSQYFEVTAVKSGLLAITSKMFGIEFKPAQAKAWHKDIEPMEVFDTKTKKLLGRFYFDLYPRDGKFKHAAVFSIRDARTMDDGSRLVPIAAIECNFPRPGGAGPALMSHQDAVTFFHEFGHVIHHLLSQSELTSFAGTSVARDFVESPSQMLEEWAWSKETLDLFAVHWQTKKPLPANLYSAMTKSRGFGRALSTQRQLFLAALDQAYHTRTPPLDTTKILQEVNDAYTPFKYVEGTHFQASFGHLIGYDAGYYGYQWALSIAQDLFTRFKKEGLLNTKTAADYRALVLEPGGSMDEAQLVTKFLGRAPNDAAYKAFLVE